MDWNRRLKEVFILVAHALLTQVTSADMARRFTRVVTECTLNYRFNLDCIELLVKFNLLQYSAYDPHLALQLERGNYEVNLFLWQKCMTFLALRVEYFFKYFLSISGTSTSLSFKLQKLGKKVILFSGNQFCPEVFENAFYKCCWPFAR